MSAAMTKEERERLIEWIEAYRANCPCDGCRKILQMAAELRRTSDYDELKVRLDAAWKLVVEWSANQNWTPAPVGQMYAICASVFADALAATSEGAKHPPGPVSKSQAKRFAALDIPYADPCTEVGGTKHRIER